MEVKDLHQYGQGVEAVFKFFSDLDTIRTKLESLGTRHVKILECSENGGVVTTKTEREVPSDVPGLLQKFLGAWNKVVQTEVWRPAAGGGRVCDLKIDVVGVPVSVSGKMALMPTGSGCSNDVRIEVGCRIPFVGGVLADFVGNDTRKNMDAEYAYIKAQIGG